MRLLVATGIYPPETGGPATHAVFLQKHLPRFGVTPTVLPYRVVKAYPKILRHIAYMVKLLFASRGQDGLYALDTISVGVPAMLVSYLTGKKLLLRVPGDYAWEQGQQRFGVSVVLDEFLKTKGHAWPVRVLQWLQKRVAERAAHVVVPSDYMVGIVEAWGIPKEKITRVYSVLMDFDVPESKEELRMVYGYQGYVVTTAARLVPWKGIDVLIRVVHELRESGMDISLQIIGEGKLKDELSALVKTLGAGGYIHLLGPMSHTEVGRRTKATDVFALNTSYEGMSHHLLEAMSLHAPVITTPVGGNVELVEHERTGLLVPFGDSEGYKTALRRVHDSPEDSARFTREAYICVESFREDASVAGIMGVVHSVWNS